MKMRNNKINVTQIICIAIVVALVLFMILPTIIGAFAETPSSGVSLSSSTNSATIAQNSNTSSKVTSSTSSSVNQSSSSNASSKSTSSLLVPEKPNPPFANGMAIFAGIIAIILMIITAILINKNKKK
jgi:predicted PurR-regulated permease PerM